MMHRILVCDDDKDIGKALKTTLQNAIDCTVDVVYEGEDALRKVSDEDYALAMLDLHLPKHYGLDIMKTVKANYPDLPVIIMTGEPTTQAVIQSMSDGALDFLKKPFSIRQVVEIVEKALARNNDPRKTAVEAPKRESEAYEIISEAPSMLEILKMIGRVSKTDSTVLIQGESGTGKELIARTIYRHSSRAGKPFLAVNCAAIPETLLESELFGYEKGAFTGAHSRRIGKFEMCDGGTIFLDEIGDMPLATQAKILRIIQSGEFERLGGNQTIKSNVRLLAATNVDLEEAIQEKTFRMDLYYRLKVFNVVIPPLRNRNQDVPLLASHFIGKYAERNGKTIHAISDDAMHRMRQYSWPGNVRELENCIERAVVVCRGATITEEDLQLDTHDLEQEPHSNTFVLPDNVTLQEVERAYISTVLDKVGWKMKDAAEILKIHRNTLHRHIKDWNIEPPVGVKGRSSATNRAS